MKYAKYLPKLKRRETWEELVTRNKNMHIKKFPQAKAEIEEAYKLVYDRKILPSMRSMQFAGKPIEISPNRVYNCAYAPVDDWRVFSEVMFLLLGGTGVGVSVQKHHVENLPEIRKPNPERSRRYLIGDSIEGWADAIKILMKSYFGFSVSTPIFDYSDIRPKGALLVTSGGKAPGPQPLKDCVYQIEKILDTKKDGDKLTPLETHDIICHIADAVLAGGIRRAALISLFSFDDEEMMSCKFGNWWELNPQRGRANNSVVLLRHKITKDDFMGLWHKIEESGSGEPGIYFSNDKDWGCNPCCEIGLRPYTFCNLVEVNVSDIESQQDLNERVKAATTIATLQAGYTEFHYLREIWQRNTEKDALIGVGMTGIASGAVLKMNLIEAAEIVKEENARIADMIGIKHAARTTTIKPSGTSSLVLGTSSGIHGWHNDLYKRRLRVGKNESIYQYLIENHPTLVEDEFFRPHDQAVISAPQKAPDNAIYRYEKPLKLLERVKKFNMEWVRAGHRNGQNPNNVSVTVSIKKEFSKRDDNGIKTVIKNEWPEVGEWMWENRDTFNGIAVLPYDGHSYKQAPFENCTQEEYDEMYKSLIDIDLTKVIELEDNTDLSGEAACAGGACEIDFDKVQAKANKVIEHV
jgi:ribonucleoside-diphosphate reductase alpha chain